VKDLFTLEDVNESIKIESLLKTENHIKAVELGIEIVPE